MNYVLETSYHIRNIKSGQELFKKKKNPGTASTAVLKEIISFQTLTMKFGRTIRNFGGESVWSDTYLLLVSGEEYFFCGS